MFDLRGNRRHSRPCKRAAPLYHHPGFPPPKTAGSPERRFFH